MKEFIKNSILAIVLFSIVLLSSIDIALSKDKHINTYSKERLYKLQLSLPYTCQVEQAIITSDKHLIVGCAQGILYDLYKNEDKYEISCTSFKDTIDYCFVES